jgi:AcrR family transcriptional regulator
MATKKASPLAKKRGSYHHGHLREALLQAASARIEASQDFDFRLRDLAEDCGVRLSACYRHFAAKHDVLVELARRGFVGLVGALSAVDASNDPRAALSELGVSYICYAQANPVSYLAMFHPSLAQRAAHAELELSAQRAIEPLQTAVARLLGSHHSAETVGTGVFQAWAGVHGYASLLVAREVGASSPFAGVESADAIRSYTDKLASAVAQLRLAP